MGAKKLQSLGYEAILGAGCYLKSKVGRCQSLPSLRIVWKQKPWLSQVIETGHLPWLSIPNLQFRFSFLSSSSSFKSCLIKYVGWIIVAHASPAASGVCKPPLCGWLLYLYWFKLFHCQSIMLKFPLAEGSCVILFFD